jgi:hypothetical protein
MKPLQEAKILEVQVSKESRQATLDTMIASQISVLERLLETNAKDVQSPVAYNLCAGLIDQLKHHAPACFRSPEENLDLECGRPSRIRPMFGDIK